MIPMTRQNVATPMDTLHRELDRAFDRLWAGGSPGLTEWTGAASYPVDIHEDDDAIYVEAELPGFKKEEIDVSMEQGILTINAHRRAETTEQSKAERYLHERQYTRVSRSFRLPVPVDEGKVECLLKDGVLNIRLSKREELKPRKIEVK